MSDRCHFEGSEKSFSLRSLTLWFALEYISAKYQLSLIQETANGSQR
jgi:hypothetical protein